MIVTLIYKNQANTFYLPEKREGQFWIGIKEKKELISIEADEDIWYLKSNRKVKILDKDKNEIKKVELKNNSINYISFNDTVGLIYSEPSSEDRQIFVKKLIDKNANISIGRDINNVICFQNSFVSTNHATLIYNNKYWIIKDNNSTNGTFVNGKKEKTKDLEFGDVIYIMGLKIIVYYDFIMINNPDKLVTIDSKIFKDEPNDFIIEKRDDEEDDDLEDVVKKEYFYRSPRFKRDIETAKIKVDPPPEKTDKDRMPMILTLGPSITMGLISLASIALMNPLITISMLSGTIVWPMITKKYEKYTKKKNENIRQEKYTNYLKEIEEKIQKEKEKQEEILKENFVSIDECEDRIIKTNRALWERSLWQNDFLQFRLGVGNLPQDIQLSYSERRFTVKEDDLLDKMYELCEKPKVLENVPITISLYEDYISGIIGVRKKTKEFVKGLIFEIASLYSYDEVKMIFLYNENEKEDFEFVKWLPHTFTKDKKFRFVATNLDEVKEISYYLEEEIVNRYEMAENKKEDVVPYYIIFALDRDLALKSEMINEIYNKKKNLNISIVNCFESLQDLPKECSKVIEIQSPQAKIYDKKDISGNYLEFKPDIYITANPNKLSIKLANIMLDSAESGYQLPTVLNFLQMFKVGKIEHLNILNRWKENDPTKSLATPIGVDTYGELFKLDLHEKFHGPHGLIAGMTGSGKSEFIITYILSLAVNYHPDEVAFILIDYKGGGMAKAFEKLPHVAGIITNLDGASIKRALVSINSELKRRQKLFDEASKKVGTSNIDIYKYQKLYREGKIESTLPHLFIISDEFAELKDQRPEFMAELISTARIGRSLGIHLILATQKPNGVVNDQIWSNSKFRICLKVQEKADSMDMLKRPDAAMLKETGRFYLQVGYNELFELGQSAWAGALYYPQDKYKKEKDNSVVFIDNNARVIKEVKLDKNKANKQDLIKQLDAINIYLNQLAKEENISARPIWLPEISDKILLEDIEAKYNIQNNKFDINPLIGEYDNPAKQEQNYLRVPISSKGNLLIYGSQGSGKTMLLTTLIYSIIKTHSPKEVNMYILDFESGTLKSFEKAPHVGDVMLSDDSERINNLWKFLYTEIKSRKKTFASYGGSYTNYIEESGNSMPNIIIAINNYSAFQELYEECEDSLNYLTREGSKYGIYFILTASTPNSVKYKMTQNFAQNLVLQFNDETNYSGILGKTDGLVPLHYEGRGLVKIEKEVYEFQTANVKFENSYKYIQSESERLAKIYSDCKAEKIPILPEKVTEEFLTNYIKEDLNIPIGVEKDSLKISYCKLQKNYINLVVDENGKNTQFLEDITNFIARKYENIEVTVIDGENKIKGLDKKVNHIVNNKDISQKIDEMFQLMLERFTKNKEASLEGTEPEKFEEKVFVINSIRSFLEDKTDKEIEAIETILGEGKKEYNVHLIIFEEMKKISGLTFKPWFKQNVNVENGIWLGKGFSNQYIFNVLNNSEELRKDLSDENFAIVIDKGNAKIVKILNSREDEEDE